MYPKRRNNTYSSSKSGMTLIEVLLSTVILAICVTSLMRGMGINLEIYRKGGFIQGVERVLAEGESQHPMLINTDPISDLEVSEDRSLVDGWSYERFVEEDEDEDGIYVMNIRVKRGRDGAGEEVEFKKLIYYKGAVTTDVRK